MREREKWHKVSCKTLIPNWYTTSRFRAIRVPVGVGQLSSFRHSYENTDLYAALEKVLYKRWTRAQVFVCIHFCIWTFFITFLRVQQFNTKSRRANSRRSQTDVNKMLQAFNFQLLKVHWPFTCRLFKLLLSTIIEKPRFVCAQFPKIW